MNIFNDDSNFIYLLNNMGQKVKINGKEEQALISNYKDKIIDYKKIKTTVPLNTGDLIQYQDSNWIIIGEVSKNNTIYKATLRKASHILKIYINNKLEKIPAIIETGIQDVQSNQYISFPTGKIKVTVSDNSITKQIIYERRFIKMGTPWKIDGFTTEIPGLRFLYCNKDEFSTYDDKENEITDRWKYEIKHNYVISVSPTSISINEGATQQITVTITDGGVEVINPTINHSSDNESVATVDNNGLVTGVLQDTCNIKISYVGEDGITYNQVIPVTVTIAEIVHTYTYDMISSTGTWIIKKANTATYTPKKYDNGNEVVAEFDFEVDRNGLTTTQVEITATTVSYIKIKNVNVDTVTPPKTIKVRYKEKGAADWMEKEVTLRGIFG